MNEDLVASQHAIRLLMDFEKGPDDGTVPLSENGAALAPYVCPGGELTIGYGCTKWFDGEEVEPGHRLSGEQQAIDLLLFQISPYEGAVRQGMTRPATQWQFDGFVCLCFNIGIGAFLEPCSALRTFNAGRLEDAAANFGLWTGATCDRPPKAQRKDPDYADKIILDHKGNARWKGPDGQYCRYMLRHRGLLYRHYAEALLFMGKDHRPTLRSPTQMDLKLVPTHPSLAKWNAAKGRWQDEVETKTQFKLVLEKAYFDDLPPLLGAAPASSFKDLSDEVQTLDLTPSMQADPPAPQLEGKAEAPGAPPNPPPATSAHVNEPVISPHDTPVVSKKPPEVNTNPAEPIVSGPGEAGAAARTAPQPAPSPPIIRPSPMPPVIAGQAGTKAPSQNTVPITSVPYRIDPTAGLKPMEESDRWKASVAQNAGMLLIRVSRYGAFGTGIKATADIVEQDGVLMQTFQMFFLVAAMAVIGYGVRVYGDWKRRRAEAAASQALY